MNQQEQPGAQSTESSDSPSSSDNPEKITEVMDQAVEETEGQEQVTLGDLMESFGSRAYGPMLLLPALLAVIPLIGAIPGMSIFTGTLILLISIQILFGKKSPWLPKKLLNIQVKRKKLTKGADKSRPWIRPIEKLIHARLTFLTEPPFLQLAALMCTVLALLFYPAAFIPFAVLVPGLAVLVFAVGLTARDGIFIILGFVLTAGSGWLIWHFWPF